jgi:microcystin-dependent protein
MTPPKDPIRIEIQLDRASVRRGLVVGAALLTFLGVGVAAAVPVTFESNKPLTAAQLNQNFTALETAINERTPPGTVIAFAGPVVPTGWLACDGSPVSRTTYATLFAAIGTAHGSGNGASTFNLPDYRGRFLRGVDGGAGHDPDRAARTAAANGGNVGDAVGTLQADALGSHSHSIPGQSWGLTWPGSANITAYGVGQTQNNADTNPTGGNETRPKNANVQFLVRY